MIDKRVIDRQIRNGTHNAAEFKRTLDALPDSSDRISREPYREREPAAMREPAPAAEVVRRPLDASAPDEPETDELDDEELDDDEEDDDDEDEADEEAKPEADAPAV